MLTQTSAYSELSQNEPIVNFFKHTFYLITKYTILIQKYVCCTKEVYFYKQYYTSPRLNSWIVSDVFNDHHLHM